MCRFAAYIGDEKLTLSSILSKSTNSLVNQSYNAGKSQKKVNGDGFGVAWYDFSIDKTPGVFKSIMPAWNDKNLVNIVDKIQSTCFLGHIRASTIGQVTHNNCHPFSFKQFVFAHNGTIRNFSRYKKDFINTIDNELFLQIKGDTDSEYLFYLILTFIKHSNGLLDAVYKALSWIEKLQRSNEDFFTLNIVILDGKSILATRFSSCKKESASLGTAS